MPGSVERAPHGPPAVIAAGALGRIGKAGIQGRGQGCSRGDREGTASWTDGQCGAGLAGFPLRLASAGWVSDPHSEQARKNAQRTLLLAGGLEKGPLRGTACCGEV